MLNFFPETPLMQAHINHFTRLDQSLKAIGLELPDMLRMTVLLASLPQSYENLVTVIESHIETQTQPIDIDSGQTKGPDFDYVTRRLLNEERRRRMETEGMGTTACVARTSKSRNLKHIKCYGCGKMGHYKSDCPEKGGEQGEDNANAATDVYSF